MTISESGPATARELGHDLLQATSRFDTPLGVKAGIGAVDLALVAFAARARRLLRAAYRLLDADEPDAASPLFRVMSEYLIVGQWLLKVGDSGMTGWALDDLRERLHVLREVVKDPKMSPHRGPLENEIAATETAIRMYAGPGAALTKRAARRAGKPQAPALEGMAREIGLGFAYSLAYRMQSQADVHATPLAIDSCFDERPGDPGPRLRSVPQHALSLYDPYVIGAHLLLDILRPLGQRVPELASERDLAAIEQRLQRLAASAS